MQNTTLDKIKTFIGETISNKSPVVITSTTFGYKVNNFNVQKKDNRWVIFNPVGDELNRLDSKRLSILTAIFASKKKYTVIPAINSLDFQLAHLKHDKQLFESMITRPDKGQVFEDRLSRVLQELENVYSQINELEKSVGLK